MVILRCRRRFLRSSHFGSRLHRMPSTEKELTGYGCYHRLWEEDL